MNRTLWLMALLIQLTSSQLIRCEYEGAICVNSDGEKVTGECTKYYALCTERRIQTNPIEVNNPETTSCRDGVIVAASTCSMPSTCTTLGIHCTDVQGTEVSNTCTSYFRECEDGVFTEVMPVAFGSKCLHNAIVLNSACTSAECTFTGIQCSNAEGDLVNTYCTGYFVECVDGQLSTPTAVPSGTSCYMNNLVLSGTCAAPACSFTGIRCSDDTGSPVSNTCSSHFVECNEGVLSDVMPVAVGTQCYNDRIVESAVCPGTECSSGEGSGDPVIWCTDSAGMLVQDACTGYYRQCVNGHYGEIESTPVGTLCKNGEIMMQDVCTTVCTDMVDGVRTTRCTTPSGIPVSGTCTKFYQTCTNGSFDQAVLNTEVGWSCLNGDLVRDQTCTSSDYECDFTGIRCANAEGELIASTCSEYYVQCEFGMLTAPRKTANGTRCYQNEQVLATSCTTPCDFEEEIRCSDHDGTLLPSVCTNYFVQCDNGLQTQPRAVAAGSKCFKNEIVRADTCTSPVCTDGELICSNEEGVVDQTGCTDFYIECDHGLFIEPRPVAYGTKCLQGQIVMASSCSSAACTFEGVKCADANGVIYEDVCQSYFVQCADGVLTAPTPVANGTRCLGGRQINTAECANQHCDFTGIKCSDGNGVVFTNTCTSYFLECSEAQISQPMPVAAGTRCLAGSIVHSNQCDQAACSYEGIHCTNADGEVFENTCTNYFVSCDNGKQTAPTPTAEGTRCRNGQQIQASECSSLTCSFEGIHCTDANNVYYPDTCTSYYTQCENGVLTAIQEVPTGTRCLKNELVLSSVCTGALCEYEGIRCSDAYGTLYTDTCTAFFVECDQGVVTAPQTVAPGTRCRNGELVDEKICTMPACSYTGKKCTNAAGEVNPSSCTAYFKECVNGVETAPTRVNEGTRCLRGELVDSTQCPDVQCINDQIRCVDAEGTPITDTCTLYYAECDNGVYSPPRPVAAGTRCYNGEQILASACEGVTCTTTDIRCSDLNGNAFDDVCTSYYMECDDGQYTSPMPVAGGTYCLAGELVLPFKCTGAQCDFTGIKCTDQSGTVLDTTCTDFFIECSEDGVLTNPTQVPAGAKCLAGSIVMSSTCPGAACSYNGFRCVSADGSVVTNTCSSYYMECVNGERSKPMPVAAGTRCYNNEFVTESQCAAPQCSFTGVKCTDAQGVAVKGSCSEYYLACNNGLLTGPVKVGDDQKCLNDALVSSSTSTCLPKQCDFTGFICSDAAGELLIDTCTDHFVECIDYQYSKPIPVATGSSCYNQQIVPSSSSQCGSPTSDCSFDGIQCADSQGKVIANRCTNYYVMCANGKYTKPRLTADGTKCYNHEQVLTSQCDGIQCSFSGIMCVGKSGEFVMNTCTTQYAECDENAQVIRDVTTGSACYNSQIISALDDQCKITVEVQENKMKGIRGRR